MAFIVHDQLSFFHVSGISSITKVELSGRKQQGSVMHENLSCSLQRPFVSFDFGFYFPFLKDKFNLSEAPVGEDAWPKVQWLYIQIFSAAVYTIPAIY